MKWDWLKRLLVSKWQTEINLELHDVRHRLYLSHLEISRLERKINTMAEAISCLISEIHGDKYDKEKSPSRQSPSRVCMREDVEYKAEDYMDTKEPPPEPTKSIKDWKGI